MIRYERTQGKLVLNILYDYFIRMWNVRILLSKHIINELLIERKISKKWNCKNIN